MYWRGRGELYAIHMHTITDIGSHKNQPAGNILQFEHWNMLNMFKSALGLMQRQ